MRLLDRPGRPARPSGAAAGSTGSASATSCARRGPRPPSCGPWTWCTSASPTARSSDRACSPTPASRPSAAGPAAYDVTEWENQRVAEGSATVALVMAAGLRDVRLSTPVAPDPDRRRRSVVTTHEGDELRADAVVLAVPAGPARDIDIEGVSEARLTSLRRQRHALAAKFVAAYDEPFWRARGQNALAESEGVLGSTWPQQHGVLSALVPPERYAAFAATDPDTRTREALAQIAELYGPEATSPLQTWTRLWGTDPWTQGYVTNWRPGDVEAVGPAARHPRAALLRLRLRPVGRRLHGGRRPHRPGRGRSRAGQALGEEPHGLRPDRRAAQHRGGDARLRRARALPPRGGGRAHRRAASRAGRRRSGRRRWPPVSTPPTCPRRSAAPASTR